MLGSGAIVWDWATPTLTGPCLACLPRAACRLAFLHSSRIRPVDKSTSACTTPLHMGWTQAMPYRRPCPRHAALCYPTPCRVPHAIPFNVHSIISWPVRRPVRPALRRPATTSTDGPGPTTLAGSSSLPAALPLPLGTKLLCVEQMGVSLPSWRCPHPTRQVPC